MNNSTRVQWLVIGLLVNWLAVRACSGFLYRLAVFMYITGISLRPCGNLLCVLKGTLETRARTYTCLIFLRMTAARSRQTVHPWLRYLY